MSWQVDVALPEGWVLEAIGDAYAILARTPQASDSQERAMSIGVLELVQDTDLDPLESDLDAYVSDQGGVLMSREVNRSRSGGRDLLTVLDVKHSTQSGDAARREISRSFCGYLRDEPSGAVIRLEMTTVNMLAFEDMGATCADVLRGTRVTLDVAG